MKLLILHWGRTGAGPLLTEQIARSCARQVGLATHVSFNPQAEVADKLVDLNLPSVSVSTYSSKLGVILGLPRLAVSIVKVRRYIRKNKTSVVLSPMESVYQSLVIRMLLPKRVVYISCIHDGLMHPGDENLVQTFGRRNELHRANGIVCFSSAVSDYVELLLRKIDSKASVLTTFLGTDVSSLGEREVRHLPADRRIVLGFFGRLQAYKGLPQLLEAIHLLHARGIEVSLKIVGDGAGADLEQSEFGHLAEWDSGWVPEDKVLGRIREFDVLVLPYQEASQSGVLVQAVSVGVPVIATPVGGLVEQIRMTGGGVLAKGTDARDLASAVAELLADPDLYHRLSHQGASAARDAISVDRMVRQILDFCTVVLKSN